MSDPVSVSASIAGLVTLADILFIRTLKYIKLARSAREDIKALSAGLKNLSEALHSLSHHTSLLDAEDETPNQPDEYRPHLVQSCSQLLRRIRIKLDKHNPSEAGLSRTKSTLRQLTWPFSTSEIRELVEQIEQHKVTLALALSADTFQALQCLLSASRSFQNEIEDIKEALAQQRKAFDAHLSSLYSKKEQRNVFKFFENESPESRHRTALTLHHPETGLWLLQDNDFQEWMRGTTSKSKLWLSGIPGAGKTILASVVIEEARKHSEISLKALAYFYCDYKDTNSQDPHQILSSLVKQLAQQSVKCFELLHGLYQRCQPHPASRAPMPPDVPSLIDTFRQMTMLFDDVFLVIDGLDECGKNTVEVTKLLRGLDSVVKSGEDLKVALFSRNEEHIRRLLESDFIHVEISARSEDLRLYVAAEIEDRTMDGRLEINSANLKEEILQTLVDRADGMFRWVACQMDFLCEQPHDKARRDALKSLPPDLNSTYERILERVNDQGPRVQSLVQRTLRWIIHSSEKLDNDALRVAVSIEADTKHLDPEAQPTVGTILKHCSSLVRRSVKENYLEIAHFTVKEFLTMHHDIRPSTIAPYLLSEESSHCKLATTCLTYLDLEEFNGDPIEEYSEWSNTLESFPFRKHAVLEFSKYGEDHWGEISLFNLLTHLFWPQKTPKFLRWAQDYFILYATIKSLPVHKAENYEKTMMQLSLSKGSTPLHFAAGLQIVPLCQWLINSGCCINQLGSAGTPLHWALLGEMLPHYSVHNNKGTYRDTSSLQLLKLLIDAGADARYALTFADSTTPTLCLLSDRTVTFKKDELPIAIRYLLEANAQVDEHCVVELLVSQGIDRGWTPSPSILSCFQQHHIEDSAKCAYFHLCRIVNDSGPLTWRISGGRGEGTETTSVSNIEMFHHAARMDYPERLKSMIEAGLVEIEATTCRFDGTALHAAARNGSYNSAKFLLAAGADIKRRNWNGETALHCCARSFGGPIVSLLLEHNASADDTDQDGNTVFHTAAASRNVEVLRNLIQHPTFSKTSLGRRNTESLTPILVAAKEAREDCFLHLLEVSDDISGTSSVSGSGIIHFSLKLSLETFKVVLPKDIDHGLRDGQGRTALHICCEGQFSCQREKLSLLVEKGLDLCALDNSGKTPLCTLLGNDTPMSEDDFTYLVTQVATLASVHLKDCQGDLPLFRLLRNTSIHAKTVSVLRIFLDIGVDLCDRDASGKSCLETLMEAGSSATERWMLPKYTNLFLEILDQQSVSPLLEKTDLTLRLFVWAVQQSQEVLVDKLLDHLDDVYKAISCEGNKSLLEVGMASGTSIPIFEKLLSKASLETLAQPLPDSGQTLVHICCNTETLSHPEYLKAVIKAGVDVNATCQPTMLTGLMLAAEAGSASHIQTLLKHGAEIMKVDDKGWTALHFAAYHNSPSVLQAFGDFEIDRLRPITFSLPRYSDVSPNSTFIHFVAAKPSILEYVLDKFPSIDVSCVDERGQTPLHFAAAFGSVRSAHLLVSRGGSPFARSRDGKTALHLASVYERSDMIDFLISEGADVDSPDTDGFTPLHHAAHWGLHAVVHQLLKHGAKNISNRQDRTPDILALLSGHPETAAMIWNHGRKTIDEKDKVPETKFASLEARKVLVNSVSKGLQKPVEQILECYTDLDQGHEGCCGCSLTLFAMAFKNPGLVDLLIKNGFTLSGEMCIAGLYPGASALHLALLDNSLSDTLQLALSRSSPDDFHTGHAIHPLHFAVGLSNYTGLSYLLRHYLRLGPNPLSSLSDIEIPRSANVENMTTLGHESVWASESDLLVSSRRDTILNIAIDSRANRGPYKIGENLTADTLDGSTPLHVAAFIDNDDAARLLIQLGANIESQTNQLATPLHFAAWMGSMSVLKSLLASGANLYSRDSAYLTPTMRAVIGGHKEALILLENYGVDITKTVRSDTHLLELALQCSDASMLAYLLQKGSPSTKSVFGYFPIVMLWTSKIQTKSLALNSSMMMVEDADHIDQLGAYQLILDGRTSLLKKLLKRLSHGSHCRVNISSQLDDCRGTPLYAAAIVGSVDAITLLVDFGADIEVESRKIGTPLMAACAAGRLCVVEYLVRQGAKETYANHERSFSALEEARQFPEIRRWLLVDRYTQQRKIGNGSVGGLDSDGRGFWAGPKTLEVPLTREWGRFGAESTLDHLRRLSARKRELEGEVLCWPEGAEHPFVLFS